MTYIDNLVGEMVAAVDESNTMIVLTSDHGWSLGQHSEWAKFSNYEEVTRVPLILTSPHLTPSVVSEYVELVDLFPSLVSLSGLTPVPECPDDSRDVRLCTQGRDWSTLVSPGHDTSSSSSLIVFFFFGNLTPASTPGGTQRCRGREISDTWATVSGGEMVMMSGGAQCGWAGT